MAGYTDTHCHLYDSKAGTVAELIDGAHAAGVMTMITVGCDAASTAQAIAVASAHVGIYATAGLHPHEAKHGVATILPYLDDPHVIAVGECGLDYYYDHSPRDTQRAAFAAQIQLAHERQLPLIVHTRDAWADTFDVFAAEGVPERTIFHCFTGGPDEARRCLDLGAFLSFSGIVSFRTATDLHEAARLCPAERMLAETDSPYLAPVPHRGRTNQPAYVTHVVQALAELRATTTESVRDTTTSAACLAFPTLAP
ncbi:MAG: TatD family hydrolase [Actinomycetota bacterium]|nr:TatD family hydrolase [Actinomycetota bacterium]